MRNVTVYIVATFLKDFWNTNNNKIIKICDFVIIFLD